LRQAVTLEELQPVLRNASLAKTSLRMTKGPQQAASLI
jgi:hypothetical protein